MICDNCKDAPGFYCPVCAPTTPAKAAVCEVCHDPTCPCGKVGFRTDAELIDALRACRSASGHMKSIADCRANTVNWRDRALAAEKRADELRAAIAKAIDAGNGCVIHGCWTCDGGEAAMDAVAAILDYEETP